MEFLQEELDEILNIFSQEGAEILQSMDKNLLLLEKKPDNLDVAMHLFRDAHSLKGSARMLGFNGIQNIAHKIEDVLGLIREKKLKPTADITDTISDALSLIGVLIKKTVEQKTEFISEETKKHIEKLSYICKNTNNAIEDEEDKKKIEKNVDSFQKNFERYEDSISGLVFLCSKFVKDKDTEQLQDIVKIGTELSHMFEKSGFSSLQEKILDVTQTSSNYMQKEILDEAEISKLNLKINAFVQEFISYANKKGLQTKNYFENEYNVPQEEIEEIKEIKKIEFETLKDTELTELIEKTKETILNIDKNKHSTAEAKSLLNEIILRLNNNEFKKIYQTILNIVLSAESSENTIEGDVISAVVELFDASLGIIEARSSKQVFDDFGEEIELLNQKASIISQMMKYELENPNMKQKQINKIKKATFEQGLDFTSIKTLRVSSDRLDKLVNQIGNLIITRIKSHENIGLVKSIQDELIELQKYYHKVGYYMKFYEKKYIQELVENNNDVVQKKDSFLSYNKQLILFNNSNAEKMNMILDGLNVLMKELQENNLKLNSTTGEIENMVKSMRVLPLSTVFNLFPRMVHNIAKDKGKEIELTINGGDVSADKKIIEDIKIPIMHIVRNSIDHGIENPREREYLGKNAVGNILIKAVQKENKIVISVKDDGRGINIQKIKQKAIEKGLVSPDAVEKMSKEQLANFIFYPGFSTGSAVTELSGRGLGLDIVHSKISQLNGRIDVYSEENKGTIVVMELPTTMATMKAFILQENGRLFAIPATNIEAVLRIYANEIQERDGKNYFIYNNQSVNLYSLASVLNIKNEENDNIKPEKYTIIIIKFENIITGFVVQKLIGDEEILNKKLPEPMLRVKNISGITTLANGEMCLLLNVSDIINANKTGIKEIITTKSLTLQDNSGYKIMLVDDSLTTRSLIGSILTSKGYSVVLSPNANEALREIEKTKIDLIITDYDMPLLNGVEFIEILKKNKNTTDIPIIMITSITKEGLKDVALKAGALEFIKKDKFEQNEFLSIVTKYLKISNKNEF